MIYLYSGTPGSGKSYHATADIYYRLKKRKGYKKVIANFMLNFKTDDFTYVDNHDLTIRYLTDFALKNHKLGIEGQTLIVIDEAQIIFNSRSWNTDGNSRLDWIKFFSQHRKLGFNMILIAQFDRMLDRQIRCLIEYEITHMKINNYFSIIPVSAFLAVTRWYGQKMKISHDIMLYRKKIANLYDTFAMFDTKKATDSQGHSVGVGGPTLGLASSNPANKKIVSK